MQEIPTNSRAVRPGPTFEDAILVNTGLVQTLLVDELDPDDALEQLGGERGQLPVPVL